MGVFTNAFGIGVGQGANVNLLPLPNTDLIQTTSIATIATSGTPLSSAAAPNGDNILVRLKSERIRQDCNITNIRLYVHILPTTSFMLQIWRFTGANYDKVGERELLPLLTAQSINDITLPSPISVQEGDFIGYRWLGGTATATMVSASSANGLHYTVAATPTDTNFNWNGNTGIAFSLASYLKTIAPLYIAIGDSIMESYPWHTSMIDVANTAVAPVKSWQYQLKALNSKFTFQNVATGGATSTFVEGHFQRDVVAMKPKFAVVNAGVNDLATSVLKSVFIAKWTSMLDMCLANNIIPIVWKIMPWTNGTNLQMQTRDDWNASLVTLFNSYNISGKIIIDWDADLGQNRVGGDVGNLWDTKTAYNYDGVHLKEASQSVISTVMLREISKKFKV